MQQNSDTLSLRILAILIAIVVWGWIQLNEEETQVKRVQISYLTPETLIQSETLPKSVSVELIGAKGRIRQIEERKLNLTLDLRDVHLGKNQRTLQGNAITNLPDGIKVVRFSPPILELPFDVPSIREVPIRANLVGMPASKLKVHDMKVKPTSISIRGPEKYLNTLEYISTKSINISNLNESKRFSTEVSIPTSVISINQANLVEVVVELKEKNTVSVLENIQVVSNRFDWKVSPTALSVLVESEDDVSMHEQILVNVDTLLEELDNDFIEGNQTISLNFDEHPELFSLPTEDPYTIRNVSPNTLTLQYVDTMERK